ncbi:MlaE family ABC transporter permease [Dietzia natronolimnaea]|uniref:MlaE family ABC transporter permease n=1 Tax=Dietzia natronolimnaea TaxID=161920 RepID=UPI003D0BAAE5
MVFQLPAGRGPVVDLAGQVGSLVGYSVYTLLSCVRTVATGRLSLAETRDQALFVARVCSVPALLLMLPVGVLVAVSVGELAGRLGAAGYAGAVVAFVVVGQASALVCALMLAGVGGSAICADLGSRTIREEVEAMEVMGLDVIERLVVPRVIATVLVSLVMCALVTAVGVTACLIYQVYGQGESAGAFLSTLSAYGRPSDLWMAMAKSVAFAVVSALIATFKGLHARGGSSGVADAVNETVVLAFVTVFVINTVLSAVYGLVVPSVGKY